MPDHVYKNNQMYDKLGIVWSSPGEWQHDTTGQAFILSWEMIMYITHTIFPSDWLEATVTGREVWKGEFWSIWDKNGNIKGKDFS